MVRQAARALTFPRTRAAFSQPRRRVVLMWWPLAVVALIACAILRGYADNVGFPVHGAEMEEGWLGFLPTKWFQQEVYEAWPGFFQWTFVSVHVSWFAVPWLAALLVSWRRPERIGSFFRWWIALHATAVLSFALFPLEPPWMSDPGVTRIIRVVLGNEVYDPNPLAAMPSLHVALPLTIALWFFRERWTAPACAMVAYAAMVSSAVILSGEHYVIDVIGALAAAGGIYLVASTDVFELLSRRVFAAARWASQKVAGYRAGRPLPVPVLIRRGEKGQALIEFAFAFPILFVFILAIVDVGFALDRREVIQHAVREGARIGAVNPNEMAIKDQTNEQSGGILTNLKVCYVNENGGGLGDPGDSVHVSGEYSYNFITGSGAFLSGLIPPITMTPSAGARLEKPVSGAIIECPP